MVITMGGFLIMNPNETLLQHKKDWNANFKLKRTLDFF